MSSDASVPIEHNAQSKAHRCPECRGELRFDAALQHMRCLHCGRTQKIEGRTGAIPKYAIGPGLDSLAQRGYGIPLRTSKCGECGALVHFGQTGTATHCAFCGSPQVLEQKTARQVVQPESLIPFRIDHREAKKKLALWLRTLHLRPGDLMRGVRLGGLTGIYLPYWAFSAETKSEWTAEAGYHYTETETYSETNAQGETETKTRQVQHTRWESASGSRADRHDDLLTCASKSLPSQQIGRVASFDTKYLVAYDPQYLVGWLAEEYAIDLQAGWQQGQERIQQLQRFACDRDVPGDTHRGLSVDTQISDPHFRHVLLPIWVSAYRYRGEVYRFLVNGQTGELVGQAPPMSKLKLALIVVLIVLAMMLALFWVTDRPHLVGPQKRPSLDTPAESEQRTREREQFDRIIHEKYPQIQELEETQRRAAEELRQRVRDSR